MRERPVGLEVPVSYALKATAFVCVPEVPYSPVYPAEVRNSHISPAFKDRLGYS